MSYHFRPLEELNVIDDFLMNAIANDPDVGEPFCRTMLDYIQNNTDENVTNDATREIHQYVEDVKLLPEVRREYMTFEEYVQYREMDARAEGKVEATIEAIIEILNKYSEDIPDGLTARINAETEYKVLKSWLRAAIKSKSIEEFRSIANI